MLVTFRAAVEYLKSDQLKTSLGIPLLPPPSFSSVSEPKDTNSSTSSTTNSLYSVSPRTNIQSSYSESSVSSTSSRKLSQSSTNLNSSSHPSQPLSKTPSTPNLLPNSSKKSNVPVAPPTVIELDPKRKSPAQLGNFLTSLASKK